VTFAESTSVTVEERPLSYIQWGPPIAGAIATSALFFVLQTFAVGIGLAVASTSPTWRDSSAVLVTLSGLYLVLAAIVAFGVGGYIAGRMRTALTVNLDEREFRDGAYGLLVWAIAIILTAFVSLGATQSVGRLGGQPIASSGGGQSIAGESTIAYDLDRLFRADRRPTSVDLAYPRSEAARILLTSAGHTGMKAEDRSYLVRLTSATTGLAAPEAERRVDAVIVASRDNIRKARRTAVILTFMVGAAALLGAAVAWFAAITGGDHRDGRSTPPVYWGLHSRRIARDA
jgi:hypothetical protein